MAGSFALLPRHPVLPLNSSPKLSCFAAASGQSPPASSGSGRVLVQRVLVSWRNPGTSSTLSSSQHFGPNPAVSGTFPNHVIGRRGHVSTLCLRAKSRSDSSSRSNNKSSSATSTNGSSRGISRNDSRRSSSSSSSRSSGNSRSNSKDGSTAPLSSETGAKPAGAATQPPKRPPSPLASSIAPASPSSQDTLVMALHETASLDLPPGPPDSEEEAVAQAGSCVAEALAAAAKAAEPMTLKQRQALGGKGGKKSRGAPVAASRVSWIQVEIPVRDDSAAAQVALVKQLLPFVVPRRNVPRGNGGLSTPEDQAESSAPPVVVFFSSQQAADLSGDSTGTGCQSLSLSASQVVPKEAERVLVVGPTAEQARQVQAAVNSAGHRPVVLVNPGWSGAVSGGSSSGPVPEAARGLDAAFHVAYCFAPLAFQGLLGSSVGALLCAGPGWDSRLRTGPGSQAQARLGEFTPWVLFKQQGREAKRIAVLRRRPNSEELQTLLYANMASESPVAKSIQFMRSLLGQTT